MLSHTVTDVICFVWLSQGFFSWNIGIPFFWQLYPRTVHQRCIGVNFCVMFFKGYFAFTPWFSGPTFDCSLLTGSWKGWKGGRDILSSDSVLLPQTIPCLDFKVYWKSVEQNQWIWNSTLSTHTFHNGWRLWKKGPHLTTYLFGVCPLCSLLFQVKICP